jgi:integrase
MTQKKLTDEAIGRLTPPTTGRTTIRDSQLRQLLLCLGPKSSTWYVHCTVSRRTQRVHLGRWPIVGIDEARRQALDALRKLHAGECPKAPKQRTVTLETALKDYLASRKLAPSSVRCWRGVIENHAASWLDRPTTALTADAIAKRYRDVAARSVAQAQKLLRALSAVLRHSATATGTGDAEIIVKAKLLLGGIDTLAPREVTIPERLQRRWFDALATVAPEARRLLLALALSGCRREELRAAPVGAWDKEAQVLRIATTKNGKAHVLPVGPYLAEALDGATGKTLFAVSEAGLRTAYETVGKAIDFDFTCHDLRRTFATTATRLGVPELSIKKLMNHAASGVTQRHYVKLDSEDVRPAMLAIERQLLALWGVTDSEAA